MNESKLFQNGDNKVNVEFVKQAIQEAENSMTGLTQKVVIVLGPSGVGKSASILTLHGAQMLAYTGKAGNPILINKGHRNLEFEEIKGKVYISDKILAGTAIPTYLPMKGTADQCFLWDMPGFGDNRGLEQILINIYYINRLFDLHKKVTLFFTIQTEYFREDARAKTIVETLKNLVHMLGDLKVYKKSLALLVTKSNKFFTEESVISGFQQILKLIPAVKDDQALSELFKVIINKEIPIILIPTPNIGSDVMVTKEKAIGVTSQYQSCILKAQSVIDSLHTTHINEIKMPLMQKQVLKDCLYFADTTEKNIATFSPQFFEELRLYIANKYALESFQEWTKLFSNVFTNCLNEIISRKINDYCKSSISSYFKKLAF